MTIVGGFVACIEFAIKVYDRLKRNRRRAVETELAKQLGSTLQISHLAIQNTLDRLRGLGHVFGGNNGMWHRAAEDRHLTRLAPSIQNLREAHGLIADLQTQLGFLALQTNLFMAPQLREHNATARRSTALTLNSFQPSTGHLLLTSPSMTSLHSLYAPSLAPSTTTALTSKPLVLGRTVFNVTRLCLHARHFRANTHTFEALTRRVAARPRPTWACTRCGTELTTAASSADHTNQLWIAPPGLLLAHCDGSGGIAALGSGGGGGGTGWACIWAIRDEFACGQNFADEGALLRHMRSFHVEMRGEGAGRAAAVDFPADLSTPNVANCGFGIRVGGREMRLGSVNFVVPAAR
jgi:hypothetical protein